MFYQAIVDHPVPDLARTHVRRLCMEYPLENRAALRQVLTGQKQPELRYHNANAHS